MSKQKVSLVFSSLQQLWAYAQQINAHSIEIITQTKTLICECNDTDIALAREKYNAIVRNDSIAAN